MWGTGEIKGKIPAIKVYILAWKTKRTCMKQVQSDKWGYILLFICTFNPFFEKDMVNFK